MDASASPRTHLALPIARHRLIKYGLLVRFLRFRALAGRLSGIGLHRFGSDFLTAHSLLIECVAGAGYKLLSRRLALFEREG